MQERKKLEELNLIDDFLFGSILTNEEFGETFGRILLETIFNRKFGKLTVVPQKVIYGTDTDKHGIQLDVHLEEEIDTSTLVGETGIYDVEAESEYKERLKTHLPKRIRFYHSKMDVDSLASGDDYRKLKNIIIVMVLPFDPFGYDQMIYTIQNTCLEVPGLPYDDGAKTLFLYTKGKKGNSSKELRELLAYMDASIMENVKNKSLEQIHHMVTTVKQNAKVSVGYMKYLDDQSILLQLGRMAGMEVGRAEGMEVGRAEGLEVGRAEGMEVGRAEGMEVGRAEGIEVGRKAEFRKNVLSMSEEGMDPQMIARILKSDIKEITKILLQE